MASILHALRLSLRSFARNPGFAAIAVGILALGIGATTAVYSVIDVVFYRPLPLEGGERLVRLRDFLTAPDGRRETFNTSAASFEAVASQNRVFDRLGAFLYGSAVVLRDGIPERVAVVGATGGLRETLGVPVRLGRDFTAEETRRGRGSRVALLSDALWKREFAASRGALGAPILLDGVPHTVVGVMAERFRFPYDADLWVPLRLQPGQEPAVFARMRPGVSLEAANAELETIAARMRASGLETGAGFGMVAIPARRSLMGDEDQIAVGLVALVGFFLLLTCADVGSLLLARAVSRQTETAVRTALGASRRRLVGAALAEAFFLTVLASGLGLLLYGWIRTPLSALIPDNFRDQLGLAQPGFDGRVLGFVLAAAAVSAILCAAIPALRGTAGGTEALLREAGRSAGSGRRTGRALSSLVAVEIALAMALVSGAALFAAHFWRLERRDLGIETRSVLTMRLSLGSAGDGPARARKLGEILETVRSIPAVAHAGSTTVNPLAGGTWVSPIAVEGMAAPGPDSRHLANFRLVTPDLFSSLGMRISEGREFDAGDRARGAPVAIVSRSLARRLWPGASAVGKRLAVAEGPEPRWREVVGVVGDVADAGDVPDSWYLPYMQEASLLDSDEIHLMVRAAGGSPAGELSEPVRRAIARVDGNLAAYQVRTMEDVRREVLSRERFGSLLIAVLAALGTIIALLGVYGVASYRVERRRGEIGVRLALGARPSQVLRGTLGEGLRPVSVGIAAGALLALGQTFLLRSLVPGLPRLPLPASLAIGAALIAAAAAGLAVPSWRAARTDPARALRSG